MLFAAVASLSVSADEQNVANPNGSWSWGVGLDSVQLDSDQAAKEWIEDRAIALSINANYMKSDWITSLRGSFLSYSDDGDFSQTVRVNGRIETRSSDASAMTLGVAAGKLWYMDQERNTVASLQGGFDGVFGSSRTIPNCTNCYEEDVDISGGMFVKGAINHKIHSVYAGLEFTQYLTGDGLSRRLGLTMTIGF